jgi:hypothetical protein
LKTQDITNVTLEDISHPGVLLDSLVKINRLTYFLGKDGFNSLGWGELQVGSLREQTRLCGEITCSGNKCNVQV